MSDQEDFDQDLTPSQEHTIAFAVILLFGAMYLFFMKGCQPIASSIGQAFGPPQTVQLSQEQSRSAVANDDQVLADDSKYSQTVEKPPAKASSSDGSRSKDKETAVNAQAAASLDASADFEENTAANNEQVNDEQANLDQQTLAEVQAREAAKIKAEAASLAAATAAQKLADEKRFDAKQAELKAGQAELAIPAKPSGTVASKQQPDAAPKTQSQAAPQQPVDESEVEAKAKAGQNNVAESNDQKPFNVNDELARLDFKLPDGRSIQIPQQGFENRFKQAILLDDTEQSLVFDRIFFFSGSDLLNPESSNQILGVAGIMNTYKDINIKLRGHTDSSGAPDENLTLSFKRSQNLKNQLVGLGIDANRIQVEGLGSSEPLSDNASEKGRNKNRRIDLTIIR